MKAKETILYITAPMLLIMTFCIVAITAGYTEKSLNGSVLNLSCGSEKSQITGSLTHATAGRLENGARQPEPKRITPADTSSRSAAYRLDKPETVLWTSIDRVIPPDVKDRLTLVETNGCVYLEDTSGVEVCDSNDRKGIEIIE